MQHNRTDLKVLAGPEDNIELHSLNGRVSTPLFDHLGSSSWHSHDAALVILAGKLVGLWLYLFIIIGVLVLAVLLIIDSKTRRDTKKKTFVYAGEERTTRQFMLRDSFCV